ncbi:GNAT family N-acetyltransferase [Reinekea thalattae]|uniref:GNAT family N-acetyltransferase n=1 Tax=Reinekea thalattae TaxID=2593301 RepID=A0A5C8Z7A6_9GAMM|nr:GNAT family N-acetyltransferase [Reinekea thalattae]TXR53184.1 GNAT family N-acetyltransferase [Reinekea thalattae]
MKLAYLADHPDLLPTVAEWFFNQWGASEFTPTVEALAEKLKLSANKNQLPIMFLSFVDDQLIGTAELKFRNIAEYPDYRYWLDGVFISEQHRNLGYATELINFAEEKAKTLNIPALYLRCTEANTGLYQKHGYRIVEQTDDKFIMVLAI